jgi:hypothetical protein
MPAMNAEVWVPAVPMRMGSMNNLAILLYDEGHHAEAEKSYREVLGIYRRILAAGESAGICNNA